MSIRQLLDILIPRFCTEDFAVSGTQEHWQIVCAMRYVEPGERFGAIVAIKHFSWLGLGFGGQFVSGFRPFVNPHDGGAT